MNNDLSRFTRVPVVRPQKHFSLVKPEYFKVQDPLKTKNYDINDILLICWIICMVFFLLNCKFGMFKPKEEILPGL